VDLTCSENGTPALTDSLDIPFCETASLPVDPWNDPELDANGIMDFLELESQEWLTNDYQMPMSKTHSPNGGLDIC